MDKEKYRLRICEISECFQKADEYCSARELLFLLARDPRTLVQIKLMEKFKYEKSKEVGYDIGWDATSKEWVEGSKKLAEKFAKAYSEDKTVNQIYKEVWRD